MRAITVIGTNVVIDCETVEEAVAYMDRLAATPAPLMSKGEADARIDLMKMTKQRDDLLEALAAMCDSSRPVVGSRNAGRAHERAPLDVDRAAPFGDRISADLAQEASPLYDPEYMCPNCVTPWKCNGPHIPEE